MPVADAPEDDDVRQTYNFAPGYHGLVYRADVSNHGTGGSQLSATDDKDGEDGSERLTDNPLPQRFEGSVETRYKLQAMKWGACAFRLEFVS